VSVDYPIFAYEQDDHSMWLIENEKRIFYQLEEADIRNGEYVFWDATGSGVSIHISKKGEMTGPSAAPVAFPITEALARYARAKDVDLGDAASSPVEIWERIQEELLRRRKPDGIVIRMLRRFAGRARGTN
jgi:hypothetical protein